MSAQIDDFGARATLAYDGGSVAYYRLAALAQQGIADLDRLPITVKILLENVLRRVDNYVVNREHVLAVARWDAQGQPDY